MLVTDYDCCKGFAAGFKFGIKTVKTTVCLDQPFNFLQP